MIDGIAAKTPVTPRTNVRPGVDGPPKSAPPALASLARAMAVEAPVDTAKVDRVRMALAAGSYAVDPAMIAEKMVALDLPPNE
ncbi:MAG: flagellar biosynthesis anti-sigma factor FlgM [Janthinobacterium lividum]